MLAGYQRSVRVAEVMPQMVDIAVGGKVVEAGHIGRRSGRVGQPALAGVGAGGADSGNVAGSSVADSHRRASLDRRAGRQ